MPVPRRLAACLSALLLAACAGTPVEAPSPPSGSADPSAAGALQPLADRAPMLLHGFERQEAGPATGPEPGWMLRYRHPDSGSTAAVFLRRPRITPMPDGPSSPAVQMEVMAHALAVQALLGGSGTMTRVPDYAAGRGGGTPPVIRCADLRFGQPEAMVRRELICATGLDGTVVTVMLSARHGESDMDTARRFLTSFALRLVSELRQGGSAQPPAGEEPAGRVFRV
ncbi:hypothetical protein [Roseomonas marmotae]|uniref:Lipoprotein n=1 Tax=Roseomonas marmotae TaxID=2768161 RepID=A0ABS3KBC2_9PROT|nr:hypothetical protein [Roseomonas marmotae]MBO1074749.1 hypothetical protein [Roseomonas marmotae]